MSKEHWFFRLLPLFIMSSCFMNAKISDATLTSSGVAYSAFPQLKLISPSSANHKSLSVTLEVSGVSAGDTVGIYSDSTCTTLLTSQSLTSSTQQVSFSVLYKSYTFYVQTKNSAGTATSACSLGNQAGSVAYTANYTSNPGYPLGRQDGNLSSPQTIAVDSSGNLFIGDNASIYKYNSSGEFLLSFGSAGTSNGQFSDIRDLTITPDGYLLATDTLRIQKFSLSGEYMTQFAVDGYGITTDSSGNIYVADPANGRVQKLDSNGNFLMQFGSNGTGAGQFNVAGGEDLVGVAVDSSGTVYAYGDGGANNRIQKFNSSGTYLSQFNFSNAGTDQYDIAVDSSGNIYTAGPDNGHFEKYNSAGTLVFATGGGACTVGNTPIFFAPKGVYIDSQGYIHVADYMTMRVAKMDSSGNLISTIGNSGFLPAQFASVYGIAIHASTQDYYVVDQYNNRVQKFNSSGIYQLSFGSVGTGNGQFKSPIDAAVDSSGNVWVTDSGNYRVQKFDSNGNYLAQFGSSGTGNGQFSAPNSGVGGPSGIAIDSSNNIFVSDPSNSRVQKFNSSGVYVSQWGAHGTGNGQFFIWGLRDVAVDSSGNVYVADMGNKRIQKFNNSGTFQMTFGSSGTGNGQFTQANVCAYLGGLGLAVDASGNIYVGDPVQSRIQVFNSSGTFLYKFGSPGSGNGQISTATYDSGTGSWYAGPYGIAIDSSGHLLIGDSKNRRVQKFTSSGTVLFD